MAKFTVSQNSILLLVMVILVLVWSSMLLNYGSQRKDVDRDDWSGKYIETSQDTLANYREKVSDNSRGTPKFLKADKNHPHDEPISETIPNQVATQVSEISNVRTTPLETTSFDQGQTNTKTQTQTVGMNLELKQSWSNYYGSRQVSRYALANLKFDKPIPSLIPESTPPDDVTPLMIASYDDSITEPQLVGHKVAATYILSSFLKKSKGLYRAVVYAQPMFNKVSKVPDLAISVRYPDVMSDKLACEKLPEKELQMPYTDSRAIQAHICPISDEIQALLKTGKLRSLKASLTADGHSYVVNVSLTEWQPEYGLVQPKKVYNFTIAMFIMTGYKRCAGGKCEASVAQRVAESVAHHLLLGFDHIFIHTVDGWEHLQQVLQRFIQMDKVTVIVAKDFRSPPLGRLQNGQTVLFSAHNERYREYSKYFFIHDPDEMLYISPNLELPNNGSFPDDVDTLLARYIYKEELEFQRREQKLCGLSFCWFTIGPDEPRPNSTSIINSFHRSYYQQPRRCDPGSSKTMTRSMYTSPYANQHVASFETDTGCRRMYANIKDIILVHYRSVEPRTHTKSQEFKYTQTFMDPLYPAVKRFLEDLEIW